jgi:Protein of unknown function (DUF3443)
VASFAEDHQGTLITLPTVVTDGQANLQGGTLTFGIDTQTDNASQGLVTVLTLDGVHGELNSTVNGVNYPGSYLDAGSNAVFLGSNLFPPCTNPALTRFYCPGSPQELSGSIEGTSGAARSVVFIVNSGAANNPTDAVQPGLAGPNSTGGVVWGLPFFYGATVYTAISGQYTPSGNGPWVGIR